ncbi:type II secretion system F family protein [Belnapia sp. T6]|uniref:Type II secretion system F family protein n=1 Tax=Belnapia mucosa TaxID=2804532 RepID=A0ABS1V733_9PROT|nr:type II secretion system F family protein [Belnapia mucosa]MBL6457162.1 type II secretion system F family protein [Belnapia mucosa]
MAPALILVLGVMLLLALLLGGLALAHGGSGRVLRERVRNLAGTQPAASATALPSIRVGGATHGGLSLRLFRLIRYNPDIPQEQIIGWPVVVAASLGAGAGGGWVAAGPLGPVLGFVAAPLCAVLAARLIFGWQHGRYCDAVFQQLPDALGLMIRAIRAGLPLAEALRSISREMPSPSKEEYARVVGDMAIGRPVDAALVRLHERTGLTEYAFLAVTLGLQSQTGGSLAETLENLAEMVRKRVAMAKRAKALAGEAKAQAGLLVILPFVAALAMSFIQPFYIEAFLSPTGQTMAMTGLGLMLLGLLTMRWLIRRAGRD